MRDMRKIRSILGMISLSIIVVIVLGALILVADATSYKTYGVREKDTGIADVKYGDTVVVLGDENDGERADIGDIVVDKDGNFYRVVEYTDYPAFREYKVKNDHVEERTLNDATKVHLEGTYEYWVQGLSWGFALIIIALVVLFIIIFFVVMP